MSLKIQAVIQYSLNEKANDIGECMCGDKISLEYLVGMRSREKIGNTSEKLHFIRTRRQTKPI